MVRVAIVGHSQVPDIESYANVEVSVFRRGGASIHHAYEPPLSDSLDEHFDIVILFLGGNDIGTKTPHQIVEELLELVDSYDSAKQVVVTQIEHRVYPAGHRYYIAEDDYRRQANRVNKSLVQKAKQTKAFRTINISGTWYNDNSPDGIHFHYITVQHLIARYRDAIEHACERYNLE